MFLASLPTYRAKDEGTRGGFCKQIFDTVKLSEESLDAAAWTLETVKIAMHNLDRPAREEARPLTLARAAESRVSLRAGELGGGEGGARYAGARGGGTPLAIPGLDPVYRKQD